MYAFDHRLTASATLKERTVWLIYLGIFFFLLYGSANQLAHITAPHHSLAFEWEKKIPFIDIFIFPYMSSDLLFALVLLLPQSRFKLRVLTTRITVLILVSVLFFVFLPFSFSFEKPQDVSFKFLFDILQADLSYNQMPSLHISLAIVLFDSFKQTIKSNFIKMVMLIWICLICLSTLFVYQHHFMDIPTGAALALVTIFLIPYSKQTYFTQKFTTPRSLKMGIYYLILALIFVLIAFYLSNIWSFLFIYLFISMLVLSLAYCFNASEIMSKKVFFLILLPYFFANHLSWLYFRNKLPLYNQLDENIYFGRMPSETEYKALKESGIEIFINLASDLKFNTYYKANFTVDLMDMTIQDPQKLDEIYQYIQENKNKTLFIHCKFGLSRTIIFLLYYLYKEKRLEPQQAFEQIKNISNMYKFKPYMQINSRIYTKQQF
ncbi:dual specificity protein phosphatase family protein [Pasteurella atlantica]|uniref:dual specificity protein phosphatase family protein n=1 Tax=Pasteurellaceae TaxID=712 RepID=UPI0027441F10|nr:dual specificity protein phosphatase family protein [Pasteurella atlantica]MDP8099110.1 dual specificity protein phosphatase family protein [Pasteurella atlantica]MDP8107136.1 dual specificity protein phosphatase family protein [Pasteurella atlantica]MDP8116827.1 dual specificity protein phosphatase family protein [Pasteurella atlantica]